MELNTGGSVVLDCWNAIPLHYQTVKLHRFVVMPNHVHGIIEITSVPHAENHIVGVQDFEPLQDDLSHGEFLEMTKNQGDPSHGKSEIDKPKPLKHKNQYQHIIPGSLGSIVRGFEIGVTKWFRKNTDIYTVWQRNFHDTIIRSPGAYMNISNYIKDNPKNWGKDVHNR